MDETIKNTTAEEIEVSTQTENTDDVLKKIFEDQLKKTARQNMLLGAQAMCSIILNKIAVAANKPGKRTLADYKRLTKDIEQFCRTGVSRKVNADGETEPATEETVQN